mmetsp:Transcript_14484/g.27830  ORF Transcript_14484/g.27830 Transcript_14484/m.27830 type:complete len:411 (+) Transcript_14484:216-1448(+)|eukprot:CAMPEP_0114251504 /NCGR_PEP_ID=MMETSP0058-20121206/15307_1 /TAXON_ID=36894 /ORGANISM="Pyramimonas parkeae, CCMP726" /LENGTH=410 /DNA_ID=CAMNT_0001365313 /DNA_START=135 /DNA_END=1367 /DNA_ORIENTATION=+
MAQVQSSDETTKNQSSGSLHNSEANFVSEFEDEGWHDSPSLLQHLHEMNTHWEQIAQGESPRSTRAAITESLTPTNGECSGLVLGRSDSMEMFAQLSELGLRLESTLRELHISKAEAKSLREQKQKLELALLWGNEQHDDTRPALLTAEAEMSALREELQALREEKAGVEAALCRISGDSDDPDANAFSTLKQLQATTAQLDAARAEAEALRDERDSLRASVSSAQEVMESMWCSMETLRKDKTRADENIAATRAEATRAAVAEEALNSLQAAIEKAGFADTSSPKATYPTRPTLLEGMPTHDFGSTSGRTDLDKNKVCNVPCHTRALSTTTRTTTTACEIEGTPPAPSHRTSDNDLPGCSLLEKQKLLEQVETVLRRQKDLEEQLAFATMETSLLEKLLKKIRGARGNH